MERFPRNQAALNDYVTLMSRGDGRSSVSGSPPSESPSSTNSPVPVSTVNGLAGVDSVAGSSSSGASVTEQSRLLFPSTSPPHSAPLPAAQLCTDDYISNDVFFDDIVQQEIQKYTLRDNPEGCSISSSSGAED